MIIFGLSGSPRLSPVKETTTHLQGFLSDNVVLTLFILAYPLPDPNNYTWEKCDDTVCSELECNEKYIIRSSGLRSTLVVVEIVENDYGKYRVTVTNAVGKVFEQDFFISKQGNDI